MRKLTWFAWLAGGGAAALLLTAVVLRVAFPPAKVKALALARLSAALGREVRLGDASISLRGARLDELEVSEVPDFKAGTALRARLVRVSPRWWPLIARRAVDIDRLELAGLEAVYEAKPAPKPPAKKGKAAEGAAPASKPAALPTLAAGKVSLKDGRFTYRDGAGLEAIVTGASFESSGVRLDGPVPFQASFDFKVRSGGASHAGRLELKGTLDAARGDLAKAVVGLDPLKVTLDGLAASARGKVTDLSAPGVELELSLPRLDRTSNPALASLPEGVALPPLSGPLKAAVKPAGLDIETLALKGEGASLDLRAAQKGSRWDVGRAAAHWGPFSVTVTGSADTAAKGGTAVDLKAHLDPASLAELAKLAPAAAEYKPQGTLSADVSVKGPVSAPAVSGAVSLSDAGGVSQGQRLAAVDGKLTLTAETAAGAVSGKLNDVPFELKLDGKDLRRAPWLRVDGRIARVDLSALPSSSGPAQKPAAKPGGEAKPAPAKGPPGTPFHLQGTFTAGALNHPNLQAGETKLVFDVRGSGSDLAKVDGSVSVRVAAGRFSDLKVLASDKPILKALLLPVIVLQKTAALVKVPFFPSFDTFAFNSIAGDYALKDGLVTVRQSRLDGSTADAELSGTADLLKDALDMRAKVKVGGKGGLRISGAVGFKATGSLSQPSVSVDAASLLNQPGVQKAVDKTLQQGAELLKGLFK